MTARIVRILMIFVLLVAAGASMRVGRSTAAGPVTPPALPAVADPQVGAIKQAALARSQDRAAAAAGTPTPSVGAQLLDQLQAQVGGTATVAYHAYTGKVRFLGTQAGQPIPRAESLPPDASPEAAALAFLADYGALFGLNDPASELIVMQQQELDGERAFVRFQQVQAGVPILGGELIVQSDAAGNIVSANGEVLPAPDVPVTPHIAAEQAAQTAVALTAKAHGVSPDILTASQPELWIYNPILLGANGPRLTLLTWRTEVRDRDLTSIRELVLVDAQAGLVVLNFDQVETAKIRKVYDNNNNRAAGLPGAGPVRTEGQAATGITDVDQAYEYTGDTYDFYKNNFGRDSIDGAGMAIISTVRYCTQDSQPCPFQNAFWNGQQVVFGQGFTAADDIVAHELTHGVTDHTAHLFYYMQSGAINEALSDIMGEFIDLTNGKGNDTAAVRWLHGEDGSSGTSRSMSNPPAYDDPDKMTSSLYKCTYVLNDRGGVHSNSGVGNKTAFLMTDGGAFNGRTVTGLGIPKSARIWYRVQTSLLTSGSDYQDVYNALQQACTDLIGTAGITASDCQQVRTAAEATELNQPPTQCQAPHAPICDNGATPTDVFFDDLENPSAGRWQSGAITNPNVWQYPYTADWASYRYATSGQNNIWGIDYWKASDSFIKMTSDVRIPTGSTPYLHFNHAWCFDYVGGTANDGGILEYSTNGGSSWTNATSLFINNGYNAMIASGKGNPLAGQRGFAGESGGYLSSRLNLSSLAGQNVRFRFRIGTDSVYGLDPGFLGWFIDDIRVYTCGSGPAPTTTVEPTTTVQPGAALVNGDFEQGSGVGWSESSALGYDMIGEWGFAHGGSWHAWLGGDDNETAEIAQTVTVPASGALTFWHWIVSEDACGNDAGKVLIDSTVVKQYDLCTTSMTDSYKQETISLAAYAGRSVKLAFRITTNASGGSGWLIDDVAMTGDNVPPTETPNPGSTYSISGRVSDTAGAAVSAVTISDNHGHSATTDASGNYTISGLTTAGSYYVTAAKSGCTFTPSDFWVTVPPSATGQNFTANCGTAVTYTISGQVTANGAALAGVTISDGAGHSATTDAGGNYMLSGLAAGSYTLTPAKSGCTFAPTSQSANLPPNATGKNFTGNCTVVPTPTPFGTPPAVYTIAGRVTAGGSGLSGVTISDGAGHSATTDASGAYTLSGLAAGSYTVTAAKSGCTFTPGSRAVSVPPSASGQDFTASCGVSTYTISGQVSNSASTALAGATVSVTGATNASTTSGSDGRYTLGNLPAGTYSVSASKAGYAASAAQSVTLPPNASNVNFVLQVQAGCGAVPSTAYFTSYNGEAVLNGQPVSVGMIVEAFSPRGDRVGCFQVNSAGLYGYMRVYGEDASVSPAIPGMRANEDVTFKINGTQARPSTCPVKWTDDKSIHRVDLTSPGACVTDQKIDLHSGLNWFSIARQAGAADPASVLATISGKYSLVMSEDQTYAPPPADPRFNTLTSLVPGNGYMIRMNQGASLTVIGSAVAANSPLTLVRGLRWLGYLPERAIDVPTALASISGKFSLLMGETATYAPPPADPRFNDLVNMEPGRGYLIRMTQDGTLTYPATLAVNASPRQALADREQATEVQGCSVSATPYFTQYYGQVTVDGQPAPVGALVEAISPRGDPVGCYQVANTGLYGYMRVYGEDATISPSIPGMRAGETVRFKVNGRAAEVTGIAAWQDDKTIHSVNLAAHKEGYRTYLPRLER